MKRVRIDRFDGGMTPNKRDTDYSKSFLLSHFNPYKDYSLYPSRDWESWITSNEKEYRFTSLTSSDDTVYALGHKLDWYDLAQTWTKRFKITLDNTKVTEAVNDVVYDLSLAPAAFWSSVQSDGDDIRVTTEDSTEVPFALSNFDYANNSGILYFKATGLSTSTDTSYYIYYGNGSATAVSPSATYGSDNVWSASQKVMLPLSEAVNTTADGYDDLTSNDYDATGVSMALTAVAGKVGKAQDLDGTADYLDLTNDPMTGTTFSLEIWVKFDTVTGAGVIAAHSLNSLTSGWYLQRNGANVQLVWIDGGGANRTLTGSSTLTTGTWYKIGVSFNTSAQILYVNGVSDGSSAFTGLTLGGTESSFLGARVNAGAGTSFFNGQMQGFKYFSASIKTANWFKTNYDIETSLSTAWTEGSEQTTAAIDSTINPWQLYEKDYGDSVWTVGVFGNDANGVKSAGYGDMILDGTDFFFRVIESSGTYRYIATYDASGDSYDETYIDGLSQSTTQLGKSLKAFNSSNYHINGNDKLYESSASRSLAQYDYQSSLDQINDINNLDEDIIIGGVKDDIARVELWDTFSTNPSKKYELGAGSVGKLVKIGTSFVAVVDRFTSENYNEKGEGKIQILDISRPDEPIFDMDADALYSSSGFDRSLPTLGGDIGIGSIFYARVPYDGGYKEGFWSIGRNRSSGRIIVALLYETSNIGRIEAACTQGNFVYVVSNEDGSVYRTSSTATYTKTSVYESLINPGMSGSDQLERKELRDYRIESVDALTSGQSLTLKVKVEGGSYITLVTLSTTGASYKEGSTKTPIGIDFEFRVESTGGAALKAFEYGYDTITRKN